MAEVAAVAKAVRQHWLSQGLRVSFVDPNELVALKRSRSEGIPEEYEAFLRIAGLPDDEDRVGFRFWSPKEVCATSEVLRQTGYLHVATESSLVIADYLQESWWYGLWSTGRFTGHVSLVLGQTRGVDPQPPLGSFVDFLLG